MPSNATEIDSDRQSRRVASNPTVTHQQKLPSQLMNTNNLKNHMNNLKNHMSDLNHHMNMVCIYIYTYMYVYVNINIHIHEYMEAKSATFFA